MFLVSISSTTTTKSSYIYCIKVRSVTVLEYLLFYLAGFSNNYSPAPPQPRPAGGGREQSWTPTWARTSWSAPPRWRGLYYLIYPVIIHFILQIWGGRNRNGEHQLWTWRGGDWPSGQVCHVLDDNNIHLNYHLLHCYDYYRWASMQL